MPYSTRFRAQLAIDYPDRVRGLLLLAPSVAPALEAPRWYQRLATWRVGQWLLPRTLIDANRELMPLQAQLREIEPGRSEEHTSELQSLMRTSYAVFCVKKKK